MNYILNNFFYACDKVKILISALYEAWSLTLMEERSRVFGNKIPSRIFGPKKVENGKWSRLHNEELYSLYRSPNIIRVIKSIRLRWAGHVMVDGRIAFKIETGTHTERDL